MPFTDREGELWLVYIEGLPPVQPRWFWSVAALPGRRLRFDSSKDSRVISDVPAGAPFLTETRLQALLDRAGPVPVALSTRPARMTSEPVVRVGRWAAKVGGLARATQGDWSERWDRGASRRRQLGYRLRRTIRGLEARLLHLEEMISGRRGARR